MTSVNPFAIVGALLTALLPAPLVVRINDILDKVRGLLTGETVRAIGYGAVLAIYLGWHAALALNLTTVPAPTLDIILAAVAGAIALVTEFARRKVWSANSVAAIVAAPPTAAGPINAAAAAGVDPAAIATALVAAPDPEVDQAAVLANLDKLAAADGS